MDNASDDEVASFSDSLNDKKAPALAQSEQKEVSSSVKAATDPNDLSFENSKEPLENLTKEVNKQDYISKQP